MLIKTEDESALHITVGLECRAPRNKVFETWTRPEWLKQWFRADESCTCSVAEVNLRVGGRFELAMALPGRPDTHFRGIYQVVHPDQALVYTWEGAEGAHVTLATALFSDRGTGSRVDFTHGVFATPESKAQHTMGWMLCFAMLAKLIDA